VGDFGVLWGLWQTARSGIPHGLSLAGGPISLTGSLDFWQGSLLE
jgi:hypothetical protein